VRVRARGAYSADCNKVTAGEAVETMRAVTLITLSNKKSKLMLMRRATASV